VRSLLLLLLLPRPLLLLLLLPRPLLLLLLLPKPLLLLLLLLSLHLQAVSVVSVLAWLLVCLFVTTPVTSLVFKVLRLL
jgi:hypothetical protein